MADVVITEFMDEGSVSALRERYDVLYDPSLAADPVRLRVELCEARALVVRNRTIVSAELLDHAPDLSLVARLGVGLDNIDLAGCEARGVTVSPATGANAAAVAEYVIGALLALFRGAFGLTGAVSRGEWPRGEAIGREIMGRRLGLLGFGSIAREVATRARAMGMRLSAHDPYLADDDEAWTSAERVDLNELVSESDAISVHVPLTDATRHLVDERLLGSVKPGAVLVNTSRGGVVEESAVVEALKSGRLGGAALDVFEQEPLVAPAGDVFRDVPNLILTPHVAGITEDSEKRTGAMTVDAIHRSIGEQT